ncbi:hypothetical protein DFH07DRAFT_1061245 [Mycena maculata]|uniref:Uncharacterized protein n=1 Tax=Mycena maculata TaxID=230809 RepID=A0AAD7J0K6_9AGAR|nr:hypothetical protein DFH07DRAFT_1061245 [Mycena maculata]
MAHPVLVLATMNFCGHALLAPDYPDSRKRSTAPVILIVELVPTPAVFLAAGPIVSLLGAVYVYGDPLRCIDTFCAGLLGSIIHLIIDTVNAAEILQIDNAALVGAKAVNGIHPQLHGIADSCFGEAVISVLSQIVCWLWAYNKEAGVEVSIILDKKKEDARSVPTFLGMASGLVGSTLFTLAGFDTLSYPHAIWTGAIGDQEDVDVASVYHKLVTQVESAERAELPNWDSLFSLPHPRRASRNTPANASMGSQGLQICPHTCGCDVSPEAVAIMSRRPKWLGRCPIYEASGTGMKYHLVRDRHQECKANCPVYKSGSSHGRALTSQEFEAWVPYIGHLPQFRPHIAAEYQNLIVPAGLDASSLPKHPLVPPPDLPPPIPARYDDFFASLSAKPPEKPPPASKPRGTRVALGFLPQDVSGKSNRTYDDFFSSYLGLRTTANDPSTLRVTPDGGTSSAQELTDKEKRLREIQAAIANQSLPSFFPSLAQPNQPHDLSSEEQESTRAEREQRLREIQNALRNKSFPPVSQTFVEPAQHDEDQRHERTPDPLGENSAPSLFVIPTESTRPDELQSEPAPSNSNYHVLKFTAPIPQTYDDFFATRTSQSNLPAANTSTSAVAPHAPHPIPVKPSRPRKPRPQPRAPGPPVPVRAPTPPPRELATFERILAATRAPALCAALLGTYNALPAAQPLLWDHLANTAVEPSGALHFVARHQTCRHCAEEFDTAAPAPIPCSWHYGTARVDPAVPWPALAALPLPGSANGMYFWDCCGARLDAPGCIQTTHAPLAPTEGQPLRLLAPAPTPGGSPTKKRKRGPPLSCGHCTATYRADDGGRCTWHDAPYRSNIISSVSVFLSESGNGVESQALTETSLSLSNDAYGPFKLDIRQIGEIINQGFARGKDPDFAVALVFFLTNAFRLFKRLAFKDRRKCCCGEINTA